MRDLENDVFYIDFINTDHRDKEIFLENIGNLIRHPAFETLKINDKSPIFILENIHDPGLQQITIGRKSLIKSLKALEGKLKLIITTREDTSDITDLYWINKNRLINLNEKPKLNRQIIDGILEKAKNHKDFFDDFYSELKDKIENLWVLGWVLRVLTNVVNIGSIECKEFKQFLQIAIKEYYNKHNFPGNNKFLPEQILTVLLILSTLSKYETYMEKKFIINYGIQYFDYISENDLDEILKLLVDNKEIKIFRGQLTARFEYRIPHIKLAEILQNYYSNKEITNSLEKIFENYIECGENVADLGLNLGMVGEHEKAIICFKKELELNSDNPYILEKLGVAYGILEQYDEAIKVFEKGIGIESNRVNSLYCLGLSYNKKTQFDKAIEAFKKAIALDPNHLYAWDNLGLALLGKEQFGEAIKALKKAIEIDPNHDNAWLNLGAAYSRNRQYEEAIKACEKAIEIKSNDADAFYNLGTIYAEMGKYEEAIRQFKKSIEIEPSKNFAWTNLGLTQIKNEQPDDALITFEKAIIIDPNNGDAWYNSACLHSQNKNIEKAFECLKRAISINREHYINLAKVDDCFEDIKNTDDFSNIIEL